MLENSTYSVISPEGCASILWKSADKAQDAAQAMGITARRLKELALIDNIISEPMGGAHKDHRATANAIKQRISEDLRELQLLSADELIDNRYQRLMSFGVFES